jgi:hypothetical protein
MTTPQETQEVQQQVSNKELNFRALEQKYQQQLAQERSERERLAQELEKAHNLRSNRDDDEDDNEPYVDHKKLKREQAKFGQQIKQETQSEINKAVQHALKEERKQTWLKNNGDFYEVMQHAEKFAQADPELAETILEMPDNFERQKLVYKNIKALGLHKPPEPKQSIQDKIDSNRRAPYYHPTGVTASPYSAQSDFSPTGQKEAYEKIKALKSRYGM